MAHKFNPAHLERLNDPSRLDRISPSLILQAAGVADPKTILDLGAGTGLYARAFSTLAPAAIIHACDVSPEMVDWMEQHLASDELRRIRPTLVTESRVDLPPESVDLAIMVRVLHELAEPHETLKGIRALLRPKGALVVVDFHKRETPTGPPLAHRIAIEEAGKMLQDAGFSEVEIVDEIDDCYVYVGRSGRA